MVRRPELVPRPLSQAQNNPPYPTTPPDEHPPPFLHDPQASDTNGYTFVSHEDARRSRSNSDISSSSDWDEPEDDDDEETKKDEIPAALKPGPHRPTSSQQVKKDELPALLRVGPPGGSPAPRISIDSEDDRPKVEEKAEPSFSPPPALASPPPTATPPPHPAVSPPPPPASVSPEPPASDTPGRRPTVTLQSQNPYLQFQSQTAGDTTYGNDNAGATMATQHSLPQEPIEMPLDNKTPVEQISKLSLWDNVGQSPHSGPPVSVPEEPAKQQPSAPGDIASPTSPTEAARRHDSDASSAFYPGMDISSLDAVTSRNHGLPSDSDAQGSRTWQEQQAWEKSERERREREAAEAHERAMQDERERQAEEEWHRGEAAAKAAAQAAAQTRPQPPEETAPPLPPRPGTSSTTAEHPPTQPPRTQNMNVDGTGTSGLSEAEVDRQRKENYSIKHIRWFDSRTDNVREAPVLTQNANGPCPLLALVNALVLSTPIRQQSTLMDALKTRETISLGFLAQELPDVSDLYNFLLALHTGMNVNPRFVAAESESLIDHPVSQSSAKPGDFEQTREMRLYSTFNIPLIHGWLPPPGSPAYAAFDRSAKTYEDAQNIQFHEEELEVKLSSSGLSPEEQNLLWFEGDGESLKPGQFAILFRNDHFSTIYKEPRSQKILTLVTDAGYSSHEEIVWESLVDVTGRGSELFSGDFRAVSHSTGSAPERPIRSLLDDEPPLQPSGGFPNGGGVTYPQESGTVGATPSTEQEDADLALAMQLQEEEDDRHRRDAEARRRRENELSHNFLSSEANAHTPNNRPGRVVDTIRGQDIRPLIPPRRNNVQTHRPQADGEEPPPPTYEQAANSPVYVPGQGLPNPPQGAGRGQSAYAATSQGQSYFLGGRGNGRGRRTSQPTPLINRIPDGSGTAAGPSAAHGRRHSNQGGPGKEEKCIVM
ncbi:hypothetical protein B0J12DRAFT_740101 [Macrophomina phaseolina]|uniref:MINDY deubiquitinase domain-containing protein n=1 Tax=Macrophomina phaseolina TaxID=35725 RepID=A0ABQ8GBQ2_9PEZI|nr:hypothetical protein B0J12DRAFT_740101 [Macrophomina phaseolina]